MDAGMDYQLNERIGAPLAGPGSEYRLNPNERIDSILRGLHPEELTLPPKEFEDLIIQKNESFSIPVKITPLRVRFRASELNEDLRAKRLEELKPIAIEEFDRNLSVKNFAYLPGMKDALSAAGLRDVEDKDIEELVDQQRRNRYEAELNRVRPLIQAAFDEVLNLSEDEIERFSDMGHWETGWGPVAERVAATPIGRDYPVAVLAYLPVVKDKLAGAGWGNVDSGIIMKLIGRSRWRAHATLVSESYYKALGENVTRVPGNSEVLVSDTQMEVCNQIFQQSGLPGLTKHEFDRSCILSNTRFMRQEALRRAAHLVSEPACTSQPDSRPINQPGISWQPDKKAGFHP